jgi:hypothetical protein
VDGEVVMVHEVHPPRPKNFTASSKDWLILIKCDDAPRYGVRILHVKPGVEVGERIKVGEPLGCYVRSGFFNFWTGPHIHVEIRDIGNPLRAKGGYTLTPLCHVSGLENLQQNSSSNPYFNVAELNEEYLIVEAEGWITKIGQFYGLSCLVGGQAGVLDGGLPQYGYCGVHLNSTEQVEKGDLVRIGTFTVGSVTGKTDNYVKFKCSPVRTRINGFALRGLSLYLHLNKPHGFKVVPYKPGYTRFLEHDCQDMTVALQ